MTTPSNDIDQRVEKFFAKHHVLTLATRGQGECYCSNMFYVYLPEHQGFVFTSSESTFHVAQVRENPVVAASIVVESKVVGILQGAQISGRLISQDDQSLTEELRKDMRSAYIKRFPYAVAADLNLWFLQPQFIKFTDNKLGFGKKLIWQK